MYVPEGGEAPHCRRRATCSRAAKHDVICDATKMRDEPSGFQHCEWTARLVGTPSGTQDTPDDPASPLCATRPTGIVLGLQGCASLAFCCGTVACKGLPKRSIFIGISTVLNVWSNMYRLGVFGSAGVTWEEPLHILPYFPSTIAQVNCYSIDPIVHCYI